MGEEYQWGIFISVDENVLERFGMEEKEWVVPVWEVEWRVGELGELREQVSPGRWLWRPGWYLRCWCQRLSGGMRDRWRR